MLGSLFNSARVTILDGKKVTIFTHHKGHKSRSSQDSRVTHPQGHKSPVWMCDWFGHLYLVPCTLYCKYLVLRTSLERLLAVPALAVSPALLHHSDICRISENIARVWNCPDITISSVGQWLQSMVMNYVKECLVFIRSLFSNSRVAVKSVTQSARVGFELPGQLTNMITW